MDLVTAIKNRILGLCAERGITINKLAGLCALPPSSIKNILYGKSQNPKVLTIKMICDGLGITIGEFFPRRNLMGWNKKFNSEKLDRNQNAPAKAGAF